MKKIFAVFVFALLTLITVINCYADGKPGGKGNTTYKNAEYHYRLSVPESVYIAHYPGSEDSSLRLVDTSNRLTTVITCDVIDQETMAELRETLGDSSTSDLDIFKSAVQIKNNYYSALERIFRNDSLYGSADQKDRISNVKIYSDQSDSIFGVNSQVILYNTIQQDLRSVSEETYITMVVPAYSRNSIYTLNFKMEKGTLKDTTVQGIHSLLQSIEIQGLKSQSALPQIFSDKPLLSQVNQGIYPGVEQEGFQYHYDTNPAMGYRIRYPATFTPYRMNSIIDQLQYTSYRIDPYTTFSLQAENVGDGDNSIQDKLNALIFDPANNTQILETGVKIFNEKNVDYVMYRTEDPNVTAYTARYYIKMDSMVYTLELNSQFAPPSSKILSEFEKICASLERLPMTASSDSSDIPMSWYINDESDLSFRFPSSWTLTENYDTTTPVRILTLKNPAMSSAVDISIQESDLTKAPGYTELAKIASAEPAASKELLNLPDVPFENRRHLQLASTFRYNRDESKIVKLVNYLDENERQKSGYWVSFIKGQKVYTLFINVSEYMFNNKQELDSGLRAMINSIADSFGVQ